MVRCSFKCRGKSLGMETQSIKYVNEVNMDFISGVDKNCSDDDDDIDVVE